MVVVVAEDLEGADDEDEDDGRSHRAAGSRAQDLLKVTARSHDPAKVIPVSVTRNIQ